MHGACLGIPAPIALIYLRICCVFGGWQSQCSLDGSKFPPRESTFFLLPFPMFSQMRCQCFPFCCWKSACHCWCWIRAKYSQYSVIHKKEKWQNSLIKGKKGKRQKEASGGECQAQWRPGKLSSSFLQFVKIPGWLFHNSFLVPYK